MSVTTTSTGGDVLAEALHAHGIEVIFGLPGVQLDAAFDALARRQDVFHVYQTRHEQATSYMADGYARSTGRPAGCLVVPGPGLLNATSGLATAYACNSPVVCVAGQIPSGSIERGLGQLHEVPRQLELLGSVTKWAGRATIADEIGQVVADAFWHLREGRPRPVGIEVPLDVLEAAVEGGDSPPTAPPAPAPDLSQLDHAARLLETAERPLLVAGGGVLRAGAWDELRELAERLEAPVLMTTNAQGALPADHPLAFPSLCASRLVPAADVILAVGTRFARRAMGARWRLEPEQRLIRIDADPHELTLDVEPAVAVRADAQPALSVLAETVAGRDGAGWRELERLREEALAPALALRPQAAFGAAIRAALPDETVVIAGMTQVGYWSRAALPARLPRTVLTSGYQGTLGYEYPTGLGSQVGRPDTRVVVLVGDGGFLFNVQELATAVLHGIPAICVVFDDGAYGNVRRIQQQRFGRLLGSELHNPDFVRLGESFGVTAMRAEGPEALGSCLRRALDVDGPVLIEVPVGEMDDPWPMLAG
ncbi:MAG: thiamine pyrophosphate-binding protein [Candidatus Dormibacteraeota bacterium]|nr:thiamine pyrophosphate-binding protein [Candidatus Dormibacteraeota bacterium]MBO0761547.1 thiamine pyrophosphate-binding protein [Candidatus Dormibacteraeota bacterium]